MEACQTVTIDATKKAPWKGKNGENKNARMLHCCRFTSICFNAFTSNRIVFLRATVKGSQRAHLCSYLTSITIGSTVKALNIHKCHVYLPAGRHKMGKVFQPNMLTWVKCENESVEVLASHRAARTIHTHQTAALRWFQRPQSPKEQGQNLRRMMRPLLCHAGCVIGWKSSLFQAHCQHTFLSVLRSVRLSNSKESSSAVERHPMKSNAHTNLPVKMDRMMTTDEFRARPRRLVVVIKASDDWLTEPWPKPFLVPREIVLIMMSWNLQTNMMLN